MKKVLVTGGLGFIGSNWVNRFHNKYDIRIVDAMKTGSNLLNLKYDSIPVANFDIANIDPDYLKHFNPDVILNFAAESHVDRSIDNPISFFDTNIVGTAELLETVRKHLPEVLFIHISTDEVFGHLSENDEPFKEESPYAPRSPYSASKASSDHIVRAYRETYGLKVIITNCCNNYGPQQYEEKLIPVVIKNAFNGKEIPVYGEGKNIREWIHVNDHNDALTAVMENGKEGETYCIGSGKETTNIELVTLICDTMDEEYPKDNLSRKDLITFVEDRPGHDFRYAINSSKIRNTLGWNAKRDLKTGIRSTIRWYYTFWNI